MSQKGAMRVRCPCFRQYVLICATVCVGAQGLTTVYMGGLAEYNFFEFAYKCRKIVGAGLNYK